MNSIIKNTAHIKKCIKGATFPVNETYSFEGDKVSNFIKRGRDCQRSSHFIRTPPLLTNGLLTTLGFLHNRCKKTLKIGYLKVHSRMKIHKISNKQF